MAAAPRQLEREDKGGIAQEGVSDVKNRFFFTPTVALYHHANSCAVAASLVSSSRTDAPSPSNYPCGCLTSDLPPMFLSRTVANTPWSHKIVV